MTTTRALAVAAYAAAVASPAAADWRSVADMLHSALPAPVSSGSGKNHAATTAAPRWFADWRLGKVYSLDSLYVRFADGVVVRCNIAVAPGKLPRVAAACRVAVGFYRAQTQRQAVPAFEYIEHAAARATYDPAVCSRLTTDLRRADHADAVRQAGATAERIAWMRAELARREAGLAAALADHAALMCNPREAKAPVFENGKPTVSMAKRSEARVAMWQAAAEAGAAELARMVGGAPPSGPVFRPRVQPLHVEQPDPAAAWCEAVADLYGEPAAYAVADTFEPGGMLACAAPQVTVAVQLNDDEDRFASHPVVEMVDVDPVEEMAKPTYPLASDDDGGGWQPDATSHPVIALCHSDKARAALFERIQDGTFPADDRTAKAGAFRLTLADALDCQGIGSLRFVGLPRKPYTRRTAAPVMAIAGPLVAIRGAGAAPVTYHAAPQI